MSKVTANKFDSAKKELVAMDKEYGISISDSLPSEINENDKGHFVVALIRIETVPGTKKNKGQLHIQQFDRQSFEKVTKGVSFLGFDAAVVLHEPTSGQTADSAVDAAANADSFGSSINEEDLRKKIQAEEEAKAEAKYNRIFKFRQEPHAADLSGMQEEDLKDFAAANEIDLKGAKNAEEMKAIIRIWQGTDLDPKNADLKDFTLDQLKKFAKQNKVDLKGAIKQEEILSVIEQWQEVAPEAAKK